MPFDPALPANGSQILSPELRSQFNGLKDLIDAVPAGPQGPAGADGTTGPLLLIQRKIGTVQALASGVPLDPVEFTAATFAPLGAGGAYSAGVFTASVAGVFRFSYRLHFDEITNSGPAPLQCYSSGTAPGAGDPLYGGWVSGSALNDPDGTGVIAFSETIALAPGQTYWLTAYQSSGNPLDITSGELLIERLG